MESTVTPTSIILLGTLIVGSEIIGNSARKGGGIYHGGFRIIEKEVQLLGVGLVGIIAILAIFTNQNDLAKHTIVFLLFESA